MPAAKYDRRGTVLLVVGLLAAVGAGLGFIIAASYMAGFPRYDPGAAAAVAAVCGFVPVIPGAAMIWAGVRDRKRAERLRAVSGFVVSYRRIRMADLANHLGLSLEATEDVVTEAIGGGDLQGFVDASTNEVVAAAAVTQERFIGACPRCGGQVDTWYLTGEAVRCPFCGTEFAARMPTP